MTLPSDVIVMNNWQCPHCQKWSSLDEGQYKSTIIRIDDNRAKLSSLKVNVVVCKNQDCKRATLTADLAGMVPHHFPTGSGSKLGRVRWFPLVPESKAKPQPSYIPVQIIADYQEAYLISGLSPKASATLSRRCLQGMIRDFFSISKRTLFDEINAIKDLTPADVWAAIDAVRKIGNIGAHMEKDIDFIVDVDEDEAHVLLALIEQLFDDWYVTRYKRQERLAEIVRIASEKDSQKKATSITGN